MVAIPIRPRPYRFRFFCYLKGYLEVKRLRLPSQVTVNTRDYPLMVIKIKRGATGNLSFSTSA